MEIKIAISLVDDDKTITEMVEKYISGFNIHRIIKKYNNFNEFSNELDSDTDLIFLDLNLGDNISLENKITIIDNKAPIAFIVIMTGNESKEEMLNAWALGADGYIIKGMNETKYLEMYCKRFHRKINIIHKLEKSLSKNYIYWN